jgi:hypothetical protein
MTGMTGMRDRGSRPPRRLVPKAFKVLALAAALTATMSLTLGGVASAAGSGTPAKPATHTAGTCHSTSIKVRGTGVPAVDRRHLQEAIKIGESSGQCVLLLGHFNVGFCVLCIKITGPVTLTGEADPTGPSPNPAGQTVLRATGGLGSLAVNEPPDAPAGLVRVSDIWLTGNTLIGLAIINFYRGTLLIDHNRVTDIRERARFRFGIGGSTDVFPPSHVLTGNLIARDNYVNTTGRPFVPGDDNGIAIQGTTFDTIDYSHNTIITKGESLEIENSTDRTVRVDGNTVVTQSRVNSAFAKVVNTVGYPKLHGGHPAALKFAGNDVANFSITNNNITAGGGSNTIVCIMQYMRDPGTSVHQHRFTLISGNRCAMHRIFAGLLGGWAGERPFFPQGTLDDAVVAHNTFSGTADFGITMMDFTVPAAPSNNLVNTSNADVFTGNDLSAFSSIKGGASLYFGPSTHNNTFIGNPHGPVVNLGKHNHIVINSKHRPHL